MNNRIRLVILIVAFTGGLFIGLNASFEEPPPMKIIVEYYGVCV